MKLHRALTRVGVASLAAVAAACGKPPPQQQMPPAEVGVTTAQGDIEAELPRPGVNGLLLRGEQVHEEGGKAALNERPGHEAVARALAAGAASVREQDHAPRPVGHREHTLQHDRARGHAHLAFFHPAGLSHCASRPVCRSVPGRAWHAPGGR